MSHRYIHAHLIQVNHTIANDCMVCQAVNTLATAGIHNPIEIKHDINMRM